MCIRAQTVQYWSDWSDLLIYRSSIFRLKWPENLCMAAGVQPDGGFKRTSPLYWSNVYKNSWACPERSPGPQLCLNPFCSFWLTWFAATCFWWCFPYSSSQVSGCWSWIFEAHIRHAYMPQRLSILKLQTVLWSSCLYLHSDRHSDEKTHGRLGKTGSGMCQCSC